MNEQRSRQSETPDPLAALGQVTGELVHDLANEVQVLQGWAMLARGEAVTGQPPVNELQRVVDISSRLGRMLRDMLETVSGQTVSPELVFDPHVLTETTVNERVRDMSALDVGYRCYLPGEARIAGRASFWSRIVGNLLINASRYAFLAIRVTLSQKTDEDGRKCVVLRVEDDGPGVSSADQSQIFQPLWRGETGGAGLGLSSVAWSVAELNGTVRYAPDSSLGGAAFEVCIPAAAALPVEAEGLPEGIEMLAGLQMLLIDDDSAVRLALKRLLKRAGAKVEGVDPRDFVGDELIYRIRESRPDVILMDVHLGERGGIAIWHQLSAEAPEFAPRVAFITGLVAGDATWIEADSTGQPVLGKPFDLQELIRTLSRLRTGD